jgi:hypothetical protein
MMFEHFGLMAEGMKATVIVMIVGCFGIGIVLGSALTAFNLIRDKRHAPLMRASKRNEEQ